MTRRYSEPAPSTQEFFSEVATIPDLLKRRSRLTPSAAAYMHERSSAWTPVPWEVLDRRSDALAAVLQQRGLRPGERIGILAHTSVSWELAQMAALRCGAVVVGLDPYYPDELLNQLIQGLALEALVVQDAPTRERVAEASQAQLRMIVDLEWIDRMSNPATEPASACESRARPDAPAVITFTSGSTGRPQPIVYSHAQVVHAVRCIVDAYPVIGSDARLVAWLPLANLFQRMINLCAIAKGATSYVVSDPRQVMQVLPFARPHVFIAVPLFCERVRAGIEARLGKRPALARLMRGALGLAGEVREAAAARTPVPIVRKLAFHVVDRVLLVRLRTLFGGNLRFIVTGSAPMPRELLDWFFALGIPVLEAYGASENLVPIAANRPEATRRGTVGKPIGDNQLRIGADGDVQVRGFGVFDPALGENAARRDAITADGFLVTGDLGSLDDDGFLTLRGRASEIFKNAQGRWVSLPLVEATLRQIPQVEHAAAIRLPDDRLGGVLALRQPIELGGDALERSLRGRIGEALSQLPAASRPIGILVVKRAFAPASGELTTNLKLRRHAVAMHYEGRLRHVVSRRSTASPDVPIEFE